MEASVIDPGSAEARHDDRFWRRWLVTLLLSALVPLAVLYAAVVLIDPFSTGRFTPIKRIDLASNNYLHGHAARIRDLRFDAAIVGNSHGLAFDPSRMNQLTGRTFAHLSGRGAIPAEQIILARAFARERRGRAPVVMLVLDELWCHSEKFTQPRDVFPTFLFGSSDLAYLKGVFTEHGIRTSLHRILMLMGRAGDRRPRDGVDHEAVMIMQKASPRQFAELQSLVRPETAVPVDWPMPSLTLWPELLAALEPETRLILYFGPLPIGKVPVPDTLAERRLEVCKAFHRKIAETRPNTIFIDRWVDDAFSRNLENFSDLNHFRSGTAPELEREIAAALNASLRTP